MSFSENFDNNLESNEVIEDIVSQWLIWDKSGDILKSKSKDLENDPEFLEIKNKISELKKYIKNNDIK